MAKVTIAGDAVVVTSALTLEGIKTIAKYRPEALTLLGGDDGKEAVFAIGTTTGTGSINQFGASFNGETHDAEKLATITLTNIPVTGDVKEAIADKIGGTLISLNTLEASLPAVLREIEAQKTEVISHISVAQ